MSQEWSQSIVDTIACEVRRHRKRRGLSAQALADKTVELGYPVLRQVLTNMETGRRATLGVAHLLVLARALNVPPMLLMFPIGYEHTTEVTPGVTVPTMNGLSWASGLEPLPHTSDVDAETDTWAQGTQALAFYRREDDLINEWRRDRARAAEYRQEAAALPETSPQAISLMQFAEDRLEQAGHDKTRILHTRAAMHAAGFLTRPLPDDLADLT